MASKDIDMSDASSAAANKETTPASKDAAPTGPELSTLVVADLRKHVSLIDRAVTLKEPRFIARVLRQLPILRKKITPEILDQFVNHIFPQDSQYKARLTRFINAGSAMEVEAPKPDAASKAALNPEVEVYAHLLTTILLIDQKRLDEAMECSTHLVESAQRVYRASMNAFAARAFFYYSLIFELAGRLEDVRRTLLNAYRTASLRHNDEGQVTLLNLLLRNFLEYNLYEQADKLVSKTTFREQAASTNQFARYLYYQGRIKSMQLDYTEAHRFLQQALRKAPQNGARGFRLAVLKLSTIVQLLMGDMPDRAIFRQPGLTKHLRPYFQITQAVRVGDLVAFHGVVSTFGDVFRADKTYTLIQRLRHNVIKTGLRKINMSYSRISLADVCKKLHLDAGVEDAEYIVAKAIRDGVIEATIDHEGGFIQSKENVDVYSSQEPHAAFHNRIAFCLNMHNDAVRAMRFDSIDAQKELVENAQSRKERLQREEELAKELEEDDDAGF